VPVDGRPFNTTLPVARRQVGGDTAPVEGAVGVGGCSLITKLSEAGEIHPDELATVKVKVPAGIVVAVYVVPVPINAMSIGKQVKVQVPAEGNPLKATLPVDVVHEG